MLDRDQRIRKRITRQLFFDRRLFDADIHVDVRQGRVTLYGTALTEQERQIANEIASSARGVITVANNLTVMYRERAPVPVDTRLEDQVRSTLMWDADIDESRLHLRVNRGIVNIEGAVDALWKREHIRELVRQIQGVVGVTLNIAVAEKPRILEDNG